MLKLFNKFREPIYDQACIVEIDLGDLEDSQNVSLDDTIAHLRTNLDQALQPPNHMDGDEFGEGTLTIYMYGLSADLIFEQVGPVLKESPFNYITVTLQYGLPNDPNTTEKKFSF